MNTGNSLSLVVDESSSRVFGAWQSLIVIIIIKIFHSQLITFSFIDCRPIELEVQPYADYPGVPSQPIRAVAFVTPEDRCIVDGLPVSQRYLDLLIDGARHWELDAAYRGWLEGLQGIEGSKRGQQYYQRVDGHTLEALSKIRTGSQGRYQQEEPQEATCRCHSRLLNKTSLKCI